MNNLQKLYENAEVFATNIIVNYPEKLVYHNMKFAKRYVGYIDKVADHAGGFSEEERILGRIGAWLISASFENEKPKIDKKGKPVSNIVEEILKTADAFFEKYPIDEKYRKILYDAFPEVVYPKVPITRMSMLLSDGMSTDFILGDSKKKIKKIYEELLLKDVNISKSKWYDIALNIAQNLQFRLNTCRAEFQPILDDLVLDIEKEQKNLKKRTDLALKKELGISDSELKELKKSLNDVKGRDGRGIQTVFRTTSKNHYTLNVMVDRKASIMITVNSIILSLVLGGVLGEDLSTLTGVQKYNVIPVLLLTLASIGSIMFAIFSIRPVGTHGHFTEEQIRNKEGNLLFYGNFHGMQERDFQWAFFQMINDQEYLYESIIRDVYYLGQELNRKYKLIRISLNIFLVGLVCAVLSDILILVFFAI